MLVDGGARYRCNRCGTTKPATTQNFYFDRRGNVTGYCRVCHSAYCRQREASLAGAELLWRRAGQRDAMRRARVRRRAAS